jgi:hypothetical protein
MDKALSVEILIFFAVIGFLALVVSVVREGTFKQLTFRIPGSLFKQFAPFVLCVGAFLGLRGFFAEEALSNELLFAAAVLIPFLLKRFGVQSWAIGVLMLLIVVRETQFFPDHLPDTVALSTLLGLAVYKFLEYVLFNSEKTFDDILPAAVWLGGTYWLEPVASHAANIAQAKVLLACLTLAVALRTLQNFFLNEDRSYIKRLILSATGGLALLIVLTKMLLMSKLAPLAVLFGAGLFFSYICDPIGQKPNESVKRIDPLFFLVLVGALTLAATRLFGTFGLLVLASTTLVATLSEVAAFAGIFWVSRVMLQSFVNVYNPNVTGINLMHPYTNAALYGGLLVMVLLSLALRDADKKWMGAAVLLAISIVLPPAIIYFLHEEPAGAFLAQAAVVAILIVSLAPLIYKGQDISQQSSLMLVPPLMLSAGLLSGQLVELGNSATATSRMQIVACIAVAIVVIYILSYIYSIKKSPQQPKAI